MLKNPDTYDYIIAGAGCAGLSLVVHMIRSGQFGNKKILIIDKEEKKKNDRTWCFWEKEQNIFEPVVHREWSKAWFHGREFSRLMDISPYKYKLIRSIDFYNYCFELIDRQPNITVRYGDIKVIVSEKKGAFVKTGNESFFAEYVFSSILFSKPELEKKEFYLLQHFKGRVIETEKPSFDPSEATLMDFRTGQHHGTTFVYVMPFSATEALVEYTLFTEKLLEPGQYDQGLDDYIGKWLKIGSCKIKEEEWGIIPMTNHRFPLNDGNIIYTGTAGGQTRASSGYTFRFIQRHSALIIQRLLEGKKPVLKPARRRFHFYDSVLLSILHQNKPPGEKIFSDLFRKNKPGRLLRFLDNESSWPDDLKIISSLPVFPFLKAAIRQL